MSAVVLWAWLRANRLVVMAGLAAAAALVGAYHLGGRYKDEAWQVKWNLHLLEDAIAKDKVSQEMIAGELAARAETKRLQDLVNQSRTEVSNEQRKNAELRDAIDRKRTALGSMRVDTARYAAGPGSGDTLAACRSEAGKLAALLADGAEVGIRLRDLAVASAFDHDNRAAEVEHLIADWPASP